MKRRLIAIDLDDTALFDLRTLDAGTVRALVRAKELGHIVVIDTARPWCLTQMHYRTLGLDTPAVLLSGALAMSPEGEFVYRNYMPARTMGEILSLAQGLDPLCAMMEIGDTLCLSGAPQHVYFDEVVRLSDVRRMPFSAFEAQSAGRLCLLFPAGAGGEAFAQRVQDLPGVRVFARAWPDGIFYVNIRAASVDKWTGLLPVLARCGAAPEDVISFGDAMDDYEMLKHSGLGFAMKNGSAELIEKVGRVTQYTNRESGVGRELDRVLGLGVF